MHVPDDAMMEFYFLHDPMPCGKLTGIWRLYFVNFAVFHLDSIRLLNACHEK